VKRIIVSVFLLIVALFISKPFAPEGVNSSVQAGEIRGYTERQNNLIEANQIGSQQLTLVGCPCDTSSPNPTITLIVIAAVAASSAMAFFIYGSHLIAALVTN
jgi:hypothetical protein